MASQDFKHKAITHLSEWIRKSHPNITEGEYKSKKYPHILPLKNEKDRRKDANIDAIRDYGVLTDGINLSTIELPKKELHTLANHLTSSQMLCYNFFRLLLKNEPNHSREIKITQDLIEWVKISFSNIPIISDYAKCIFEYKFDDGEGTSCDFCVTDGSTTILFEIKYTEDCFSKAKNDLAHQNKFKKVYKKILDQQDTVCKNVPDIVFFKDYQLFRNAIRTNRNTFFVVIYPANNTKCDKEFKEFIKNKYIQNKDRILGITWETAFSNSPITVNSDLKGKYNL